MRDRNGWRYRFMHACLHVFAQRILLVCNSVLLLVYGSCVNACKQNEHNKVKVKGIFMTRDRPFSFPREM